jgi:hypothetical protein
MRRNQDAMRASGAGGRARENDPRQAGAEEKCESMHLKALPGESAKRRKRAETPLFLAQISGGNATPSRRGVLWRTSNSAKSP